MGSLILRGDQPDWIGSGSGYGDGSDYGDGLGSDGNGYGYGGGYGSSYGAGFGYGDGCGFGDGDGSGFGYGGCDFYGAGGGGYGDGDGDGDGSGGGDGSGEYWLATIDGFASKWPTDFKQRLASRREAGATIAFWRSSSAGLPANGGGEIEPAAPGVVHTASGPLALCNRGTLHATLLPPRWEGERWWIVALVGDVIGDENKYGALTREILGEAL